LRFSSKEFANDYRYFPEPDLLPVEIDDAYIQDVRDHLPELPDAKIRRFRVDYGLSDYDATVLAASRAMADYFEAVVGVTKDAKLAANWCMGELAGQLNRNEQDITDSPVSAAALGQLIQRIQDNTISNKIAKTVFEAMFQGDGSADDIIEAKSLKQVSDSGAIESMIDEVIAANPAQVADYRSGKDKLFGFFVGQVMKASKGQANPAQVNELLKSKLQG
jgi:aspartyl-tRNA(Asn)/glutamyl-tRNA(Gln) amidotransferase subunit B